ncbi:MAG: hypothetical protein HC916_15255 [Coleofasciculaceae cyanobacterium SM2_1_6]|nr:hypothetical protein [Coleofasciculaceae cyanobacterium SM2_1_6]
MSNIRRIKVSYGVSGKFQGLSTGEIPIAVTNSVITNINKPCPNANPNQSHEIAEISSDEWQVGVQ